MLIFFPHQHWPSFGQKSLPHHHLFSPFSMHTYIHVHLHTPCHAHISWLFSRWPVCVPGHWCHACSCVTLATPGASIKIQPSSEVLFTDQHTVTSQTHRGAKYDPLTTIYEFKQHFTGALLLLKRLLMTFLP